MKFYVKVDDALLRYAKKVASGEVENVSVIINGRGYACVDVYRSPMEALNELNMCGCVEHKFAKKGEQ